MAKQKLPFAQRAAYFGVGVGLISGLLSIIADLLFKHTSVGAWLGAETVDAVLTWLTGGMLIFYVSALLVVVAYVLWNFLMGMWLASQEGAGLARRPPGASNALEDDDDYEDGLGTPYSMSGLYPDDDMRSEPLLDDWNSNR